MAKRLIQIANLLLITAAVFFSVKLFYQFIQIKLDHAAPTFKSAKPTAIAQVNNTCPPFDDYQAILDRDLFDTKQNPSNKKPEPEIDLETLEQTRLDLKLWGTVDADENKAGIERAVIEDCKANRQGLYRVGDTIRQATISRIFRNGVVLDINGRKEKLTIEEEAGAGITGISNPRLRKKRQASIPPPASTASTASTAPGQKISLKRTQVDNALENMNKLMKEVKIEPHFVDGNPEGFMVESIAPDSIVRTMGLKTGDIVTGINGQKIKTADDAMEFYERLKAGEKLSIQLKRRGRPETIEYMVEDEVLGSE